MSDYNMELSERVRGKGVGFDHVRRITGYLVGTLDRFNSAKAAEERDRVKHNIATPVTSCKPVTIEELKEHKELIEV